MAISKSRHLSDIIGTDGLIKTEATALAGPDGTLKTDDVAEGTVNKYYTDARADARVAAGIANLVDTAPTTLDTLNELAAALGDDPNFATTVTTALGTKAPLASPSFTGIVQIGKTDAALNTDGWRFDPAGGGNVARSSGTVFNFNRKTTDGEIIGLYKDGTYVGSIGTLTGATYYTMNSTKGITTESTHNIVPCNGLGAPQAGGYMNIGSSTYPFNDLHLSGNMYLNTATARLVTLSGDSGAGGRGNLEIRSNYQGGKYFTAIHALPSDITNSVDGGLYLGAISSDNSDISSGSYYNLSGLYMAKAATASGINMSGGNISFSTNTGLTPDTTFSRTTRMTISDSGVNVTGNLATGSITSTKLAFDGDGSAYDDVTISYNGYNGGAPKVLFQPRTTPGSGVVNTTFHFANSNGTSTTSNNTANVEIDGYANVKGYLLKGQNVPVQVWDEIAGCGISHTRLSFIEGSKYNYVYEGIFTLDLTDAAYTDNQYYLHFITDANKSGKIKISMFTSRSGSERTFGHSYFEAYSYAENDGDFRNWMTSEVHNAHSRPDWTPNVAYISDIPQGFGVNTAANVGVVTSSTSAPYAHQVWRVPYIINDQGIGFQEIYIRIEEETNNSTENWYVGIGA